MSKTPRTDEKTYAKDVGDFAFVGASFARKLETELADKDRQLAEALQMLSDHEKEFAETRHVLIQKTNDLAEARAEIERKDALIEYMREALKIALSELESEQNNEWGEPVWHQEEIEQIKAALTAERGEL